jgi:hypothetical protein
MEKKPTLLQQIESEVLAEGQEWMQKRLEQRLEELAEKDGEISPPQRGASGSPTAKPHNVD